MASSHIQSYGGENIHGNALPRVFPLILKTILALGACCWKSNRLTYGVSILKYLLEYVIHIKHE